MNEKAFGILTKNIPVICLFILGTNTVIVMCIAAWMSKRIAFMMFIIKVWMSQGLFILQSSLIPLIYNSTRQNVTTHNLLNWENLANQASKINIVSNSFRFSHIKRSVLLYDIPFSRIKDSRPWCAPRDLFAPLEKWNAKQLCCVCFFKITPFSVEIVSW